MKELQSYLLSNLEELKMLVAEINAYNGSLDSLEVYANEEYTINELFSSPYDVLRSCYYGYYNFNDSLLRFDGYGNIESLSEHEYELDIQDSIEDIICELLKVYNKIDVPEEICSLIKKML